LLKQLKMATKIVKEDSRDLIMKHLNGIERNLSWLVKKTKLSYGHLYAVLVKKERDLTDENKDTINKILNTSF
jgi:hypothetical protein